MFEPGHWYRASLPGVSPTWHLDLRYEVEQDPKEGQMLCLHITGARNGKPFSEELRLHRDTAMNFASKVGRIAERHGLPVVARSPVLPDREEYDRVFEDIRQMLGLQPGEPINLEHVQRDLLSVKRKH